MSSGKRISKRSKFWTAKLFSDLHKSTGDRVRKGSRVPLVTHAARRKIRLQVQGQLGGIKRGAGHIIKELGVLGLYKGATACLLRCV
jgi:hypothetical protein